MQKTDLRLLCDWLNRPHLQQWWSTGAITLAKVSQKYLPRIAGKDDAIPFVVYLDKKPVGYIQYYLAANGSSDWWPDVPGEGVVGIDQFIADNELLGQGLGTAMITQFIARLFEDPKITEIRVDPRPDNLRAIRCYSKVGFRKVGPITTPDGAAIMMVLLRES